MPTFYALYNYKSMIYFLKILRIFVTESAMSEALLKAVAAVAAVAAVFSETAAVVSADFVLIRPERSTLFTRLVNPLITFDEFLAVTRLPEPRIRPEAKSL